MRRWVRRQLAISWIVSVIAIAAAISLDSRLVLYSRFWGALFGLAAVAWCASSMLVLLFAEGRASVLGLPGLFLGLLAFFSAGAPTAFDSDPTTFNEFTFDGPNSTRIIVRNLVINTDPACNHVELRVGTGIWRRHEEYSQCWPDKVAFEFVGSEVIVHNCPDGDRVVRVDRSRPAFVPGLETCRRRY